MSKKQLAYNNVFDAITDDGNEAADLKFRADMMIAMRRYFEDLGWDQARIGEKLGIPQPRVSELVNGKIKSLSSDKLIGYLAKLGFHFKPLFKASTPKKQASITCSIEDCAGQR